MDKWKEVNTILEILSSGYDLSKDVSYKRNKFIGFLKKPFYYTKQFYKAYHADVLRERYAKTLGFSKEGAETYSRIYHKDLFQENKYYAAAEIDLAKEDNVK